MKKIFLFISCSLIISCGLLKKFKPLKNNDSCLHLNNDDDNRIYIDFPEKDLSSCDIEDVFYGIKAIRRGRVKNGYREGYFGTGIFHYDVETNKDVSRTRDEYFKKGLRDSIFRQFNSDGKIIYETTFKMGTGLWKEYHSNGKLYFEAFTKDGFFTDTLKLYNDKGILSEKLLYKKDSLIFRENMIIDDNPTDNKN